MIKDFIKDFAKWTAIAAITAGMIALIDAVINGVFDPEFFKLSFYIAAIFLDGFLVLIYVYLWIE